MYRSLKANVLIILERNGQVYDVVKVQNYYGPVSTSSSSSTLLRGGLEKDVSSLFSISIGIGIGIGQVGII